MDTIGTQLSVLYTVEPLYSVNNAKSASTGEIWRKAKDVVNTLCYIVDNWQMILSIYQAGCVQNRYVCS